MQRQAVDQKMAKFNYEKKRENYFSLSLVVCVSVSNATGTVTGLPNQTCQRFMIFLYYPSTSSSPPFSFSFFSPCIRLQVENSFRARIIPPFYFLFRYFFFVSSFHFIWQVRRTTTQRNDSFPFSLSKFPISAPFDFCFFFEIFLLDDQQRINFNFIFFQGG